MRAKIIPPLELIVKIGLNGIDESFSRIHLYLCLVFVRDIKIIIITGSTYDTHLCYDLRIFFAKYSCMNVMLVEIPY